MGQLVTRRGGLGWGSSRGGTFRWLWRARVGSPYSPLWHLLLPPTGTSLSFFKFFLTFLFIFETERDRA